MITKTIKLNARAAVDRLALPPAFVVAALVFIVAGGISAVGRYTGVAAMAVPTPALDPIIIIATPQIEPMPIPAMQVAAVLPRFVVCYDQPIGGSVLGSIPGPAAAAGVARYGVSWVMVPWDGGYCWLHAADVGLPDVADLQPTEAPVVIYVAAQPAYAAPTPATIYQTNNDPPAGDFYTTPPHSDPAAQQALIGSDPNALACNGSPLCGGLTNAEAQAALDQQRAGR
jgi:hypothetical protein